MLGKQLSCLALLGPCPPLTQRTPGWHHCSPAPRTLLCGSLGARGERAETEDTLCLPVSSPYGLCSESTGAALLPFPYADHVGETAQQGTELLMSPLVLSYIPPQGGSRAKGEIWAFPHVTMVTYPVEGGAMPSMSPQSTSMQNTQLPTG